MSMNKQMKKRAYPILAMAIIMMAFLAIIVPSQASGAVAVTVTIDEEDSFGVIQGDTVTMLVNITGATALTSVQVAVFDQDAVLLDKIWINQSSATTFEDTFEFANLTDGMWSFVITGTQSAVTTVLSSEVHEVVVNAYIPTGIKSWTDGLNIGAFIVMFLVILCVVFYAMPGKQLNQKDMKHIVLVVILTALLSIGAYVVLGGILMDIYNWIIDWYTTNVGGLF